MALLLVMTPSSVIRVARVLGCGGASWLVRGQRSGGNVGELMVGDSTTDRDAQGTSPAASPQGEDQPETPV
jgi:hypothetical protein